MLYRIIIYIIIFLSGTGYACTNESRSAVEVKPPPQQQNSPPVICSIGSPDRVFISSKAIIKCIAEDEDGDEITYSWSCDNGTIEYHGAEVYWMAPGIAGSYNINVTANDTKGSQASDSIVVKVTDIPNRPPAIDHFIIMAPKPVGKIEIYPVEELYIQPKVSVRIYTPLPISLAAEDPDDDILEYEWTCTEGKITDNENNKIVWIAPTNPIRQVITVAVRDNHGGLATARLAVDISCCK